MYMKQFYLKQRHIVIELANLKPQLWDMKKSGVWTRKMLHKFY